LLFQTLDDKLECVGLYYNNELCFGVEGLPSDLSQTWKYTSYLREYDSIEYANLYVGGKKIEEVVPEVLQDDWQDVRKKLTAFQRTLGIAKVNTRENCLYDLMPSRLLIEYCEVKNRVTSHILENIPRPPRYKFLLSVCQMLEDISNRPLNLNTKKIKSYLGTAPENSPVNRLATAAPHISYNQFGTKTGRLTTNPGSFPILTLKKELRTVIEPHNDYFLELDFNGAEARVMMGVLGMEQPDIDIHNFHKKEIFHSAMTRPEAKTAFFAWLYGSTSQETQRHGKKLEEFYDKDVVLDQYWDGKNIHTPYRKVIKNVGAHRALNYIIQSTTAELTLLQALKIDYLLRKSASASYLSCIIHDAIVIDFKKEDEHLIPAIKKLMSSTNFGEFKINISEGKNLGNLREAQD
tara:strand:+ start:93 stop:1313 length:1221 start_codon:yes stop_codon:yes gene_type:complete